MIIVLLGRIVHFVVLDASTAAVVEAPDCDDRGKAERCNRCPYGDGCAVTRAGSVVSHWGQWRCSWLWWRGRDLLCVDAQLVQGHAQGETGAAPKLERQRRHRDRDDAAAGLEPANEVDVAVGLGQH